VTPSFFRWRPEAVERFDPLGRFEAAAVLCGGVLLGHVEELENDRPGLDGAFGLAEITDRRFAAAVDVPGQRLLAETLQHLDEAVEQVTEIECGFVEIDDADR